MSRRKKGKEGGKKSYQPRKISLSHFIISFAKNLLFDFHNPLHFICSLKDFKEFADAIKVIKEKGVVVAVASPDDVAAANEERPGFFNIRKAL